MAATLVQKIPNSLTISRATAVSSLSVTFGSNTTAGNLIVVTYEDNVAAVPLLNITDTFGNTYTDQATVVFDGGDDRGTISSSWITTGGASHQVTASFPSGTGIITLGAIEVSGTDSAGTVKGVAQGVGGAGATNHPRSGPLRPLWQNHFYVGCAPYNGNLANISRIWTADADIHLDNAIRWGSAYRVTNNVNVETEYELSTSGTVAWAGCLAAFPQLVASITAEPSDALANVGETAVFTVTASGTGALSYQWQVSTDGGVTWANVSTGSGGTTDTFTTATLGYADDDTYYRCEVTDNNGPGRTRGAVVRIRPSATAGWQKA